MADAAQQAHNARAAQQMALLANVNRNPKKRSKPYTAADFMPQEAPEPIPATIEAFKAFLPKGGKK